jgi:hypothetical protein
MEKRLQAVNERLLEGVLTLGNANNRQRRGGREHQRK